MRVAVVGAGHIATVHGPIILKQPNTEIVGVADKDVVRAKVIAAELNGCQFYQDAKVMIEEQEPDIVHVLSPPQYHAELSIMAMNQGCHVLVEKPMALSMDDAQKMVQVSKQNNVRLCVNHNMVFENVVHSAMELVSQGAIGEIVSVEACYQFNVKRYPAIIEDGAEYCHWTYQMNGGPLQDLMPHPASLVFEFIPDIKKIQFIGHNRGVLPKSWQDEIRVLINSSSVIGYISISLSEKPDIILFTMKGTKGIIQADLFNDIVTLRKKSSLPRAVTRGLSGFQLSTQYLKGFIRNIFRFIRGRVDKSNGVEPLISKLYESIQNGGESPISLDKSLRVVELMTRIWPSPVIDTKKIIHHHVKKNIQAAPTALVTGASGFIGTHLIKKLLSENIGVRALVRPNSIHAGRLKRVPVDIIEGDLIDPEVLYQATKGIETIYHAGSPMSNTWEQYEKVAIGGTEKFLEAAISNRVKRFVQFSSLTVYELLRIKHKTIREDSPYQKNPQQMGPYAWAKIATEKLVFEAYRKHGLGVTVVRPAMVFGPMGRVFFPHLGYRYQDSIFLLIDKGDIILPLTYVENTVDGIYKASVVEKAIGQAYNLIDDGEITARSYLDKFVKINGTPARIICLPYILPYCATLAYEILSNLGFLKKGVTSRAQLKWKQSKVSFDNTKAKNELGWTPHICIEEGLTRTFKWYAAKYGSKD